MATFGVARAARANTLSPRIHPCVHTTSSFLTFPPARIAHEELKQHQAKRAKHTHSLDLTQRAKALQRPQQPASQSDDSDRDSAVDYDDGDSDDDEALDDAAYDDETIMERFNAYKASQGKNSDKVRGQGGGYQLD